MLVLLSLKVERSRSRSPLHRKLNLGESVKVDDRNNEKPVDHEVQSVRDKDMRGNINEFGKPVGFEWVKPKKRN